MAKISISIEDVLLEEIRKHAGTGGVSRFLAEAAELELRVRAMDAYVAEVEAESGPLTPAEIAEAKTWLSSATPRS